MKNPTEPLIYDNGGKTLDRYTVVIPDGSVISMSQNGLGINMYIGDFQRDYNGKLSHTLENVSRWLLAVKSFKEPLRDE
jgi:hypothetical protein